MLTAGELIVAARPECELRGKWGILAPQSGRWIDVLFATERDADEALNMLLMAGRIE